MLTEHFFVLNILIFIIKSNANLNTEKFIILNDHENNNGERDGRLGDKEQWLPVAFCKSGLPLLRSKICNGKVDCLDGSDETADRCKNQRCKNDNFRCDYGGCVSKILVCNGVFNCADGSDETRNVCKTVNCVIPYPTNNTVYFVSGCDDCRSGSRTKDGTVLNYQCTSDHAEMNNDSVTNVICRNGVWIPSIPVCKDTAMITETTSSTNVPEANITTASKEPANVEVASEKPPEKKSIFF